MSVTLKVKLLTPTAKAPIIAHPGEDIGYDLYADENVIIHSKGNAAVKTGIAVELLEYSTYEIRTGLNSVLRDTFVIPSLTMPYGAVIRDRSSMGKKRIKVMGGEIDAGYRGEVVVMLENFGDNPYEVKRGDKIAQLRPVPVYAGNVVVSESLGDAQRGDKGFGSSGI
jgi:dUTP pyrophosphatase